MAVESRGPRNIIETAKAAGQFSTLVKAVEAAGLASTLSGDGPFTVFAPTDEAFSKLPAGTLDDLLKNPEALKSVLLLHVVPGKLMAADVVKVNTATTALGQSLPVDASNGVKIGNAKVVKTDVVASNGVIHVIDGVLLPKNDIIEVARSAGSFKTLLTAIEAAGLTETLRGDGPFTVFAPTDDAFAKLPKGTLEALLKDKQKLTAVLTYHVAGEKLPASDVVTKDQITTVQGQRLKVAVKGDVTIGEAKVLKADVTASNGIIHVIDKVLLPE